MSVIVKNMRMPETCIQCPMQFGGWCYVSPPEIDERVAPTVDEAWEQKKPKWCPLEEQMSGSDCISREQAVYVASGYCHPQNIADELRKLPSVVPQPKTGHWIKHEHNGIGYIECSKCSVWFLHSHLLRNSYCPNCGARMVKPQERSDKE